MATIDKENFHTPMKTPSKPVLGSSTAPAQSKSTSSRKSKSSSQTSGIPVTTQHDSSAALEGNTLAPPAVLKTPTTPYWRTAAGIRGRVQLTLSGLNAAAERPYVARIVASELMEREDRALTLAKNTDKVLIAEAVLILAAGAAGGTMGGFGWFVLILLTVIMAIAGAFYRSQAGQWREVRSTVEACGESGVAFSVPGVEIICDEHGEQSHWLVNGKHVKVYQMPDTSILAMFPDWITGKTEKAANLIDSEWINPDAPAPTPTPTPSAPPAAEPTAPTVAPPSPTAAQESVEKVESLPAPPNDEPEKENEDLPKTISDKVEPSEPAEPSEPSAPPAVVPASV